MPPQGLQGLPGVLVTGTLANPVLVNNTNQKIIGYVIFWVPGEAQTVLGYRTLARQGKDVLPPGGQVNLQPTPHSGPPAPRQAVVLGAVIFDNGDVIGPSAPFVVDTVGSHMQGEKDIHQLLLKGGDNDATWAQIEKAANMNLTKGTWGNGEKIPPKTFLNADYAAEYKNMAHELVAIRDAPLGGHAKAMQMAHTSENYPTLRVKK